MTQSISLRLRRTGRRRAYPAACVGIPAAAALATLSFANAAAGVGLPVRAFASLGPSFFAWRPGYQKLEEGLAKDDGGKAQLEQLQKAERRILSQEPLTIQPLRLAASLKSDRGDQDGARLRMKVAERITRRDTSVQTWLIDDALRANDIDGAIRHYDVVLRTKPDLQAALLRKLTAGLALGKVRKALAPYAIAESPWFPDLLLQASQVGLATQAASSLSAARSLPDTPAYRTAYRTLTLAMERAQDFDQLRAFYTRLPGTDSGVRLTDPTLRTASETEDYPPFLWMLTDNADRIATVTASDNGSAALQVEAEPFTNGVAASRMLLPSIKRQSFAWTVERLDKGSEAEAYWSIRCRDSGLHARSSNILAGNGKGGFLPVPDPCRVMKLTLIVDGGTGSTGPVFRLTRLRWLAGSDRNGRPLRTGNASIQFPHFWGQSSHG